MNGAGKCIPCGGGLGNWNDADDVSVLGPLSSWDLSLASDGCWAKGEQEKMTMP